MKISLLSILLGFMVSYHSVWGTTDSLPTSSGYLEEIKNELRKEWPSNRTINLVFHGHSVPAGYFKTPLVNTIDAYPYQVLRQLKDRYPFAVINIINTSIGGENAVSGQKRFETEVLNHNPDVLFIDYALNDRRAELGEARKAWEKMIESAKRKGVKIILLTPSPDLGVDLSEKDNELEKHANQITELAMEYETGLADSYYHFKQLQTDCDCVADYMSQSNHPNADGHRLIALEIMKYF
ncbi:GDSL-type esterase/lipase family protein [Cyclobacterium sp.]|uniref:SGNH/GDSL hydrolase family protein n=1 Tax=Cyclobacterium sp. TaxID=1966343 RepID=UPI0019B34BD9|nr:GDSL-type esterase/lipase family protein [Cyclobacterium sp.]MBD3629309.1 SGNH/GDSL hydrolase family protein [Cyclobacterium sp.]